MTSLTHATDHTIIDVAVSALRSFGGDRLTRPRAALLLTAWKYNGDLTTEDRMAVLDAYASRRS